MKSLIVHYHLKPGGVSSVIKRQMSALAELGHESCALVGESGSDFSACVAIEPALAYDAIDDQADFPKASKVEAIVKAVEREAAYLGEDTVIHVHNPVIRKNSSLLTALSILSGKGFPLVLQVHDLAEDWRPDVYSRQPYPERAHWLVINHRDEAMLKNAGADYVTCLPNSVPSPKTHVVKNRKQGPGLILYPVRALRRKNIGEAILLSFFMRKNSRIGITLPPNSPKDISIYEDWKKSALRYRANISFALGLSNSLEALYEEAISVLSTSVKEGFGLSFLEPISWSRPIMGRRINNVIDDFEKEGLSFSHLYKKILIPVDTFDQEAFLIRVAETIRTAELKYGSIEKPELFPGAQNAKEFCRIVAESIIDQDRSIIDFGRLDEIAQREVLSHLYSKSQKSINTSKRIIELNPFIEEWDRLADSIETLTFDTLLPWEENSYGNKLLEVYKSVLTGQVGSAPDKFVLLQKYLTAEAFYGTGV